MVDVLAGQTVFVVALREVAARRVRPWTEVSVDVAARPVLRFRRAKLWPTLIVAICGEGGPEAVQHQPLAARLVQICVRRAEVPEQIGGFVES